MSKRYFKLGLFSFAMAYSLLGFTNPCMTIAEVCMQKGYYKGGHGVGKGLVEDCVLPVASHQKTLANTHFDNRVLQECKTMIEQRMRPQ